MGLRDVNVTIPQAVKKGDNALFVCEYDLEGDTLYSVKWYKGGREFYRYTPKENPAMKIFPVPGISVEVRFVIFEDIFHITSSYGKKNRINM